jgi:hypothetical protein
MPNDNSYKTALINEVAEAIGRAVDGFDGQGKDYLVEAEAAIRATFRFYRNNITESMVEMCAKAIGGDEWNYERDRPRFRAEAKEILEAALAS